jgi:SAM-dependent methyltransferase
MNRDFGHFDKIANSYDEQLPGHIRQFLLTKKTRLTVKTLKKYDIAKGKGIDLGCGTGWYLKAISEYGYAMTGIDNSSYLIDEAKANNQGSGALLETGDMLKLRFAAGSFDFAYCINSLHHLAGKKEVQDALSEIHRVLRNNGLLIIHELNAFLLFRLYLNYIFPLTNKIDKLGGENWLLPQDFSGQKLFEVKEIYYYTFFPHIIPRSLFGLFCKINSYMERISLRKIGVHYMAVLKKC